MQKKMKSMTDPVVGRKKTMINLELVPVPVQ
jgi:hypothetical protein